MGRILSVRLSAVTYNEDDVFRAWPRLCVLAWPGKGEIFGNVWKPASVVFAPPIAPEPIRRGVVELAASLFEEFAFGDWDAARKTRLQTGVAELKKAAAALEIALADWQPQAANTATSALEDALDALEREMADE